MATRNCSIRRNFIKVRRDRTQESIMCPQFRGNDGKIKNIINKYCMEKSKAKYVDMTDLKRLCTENFAEG